MFPRMSLNLPSPPGMPWYPPTAPQESLKSILGPSTSIRTPLQPLSPSLVTQIYPGSPQGNSGNHKSPSPPNISWDTAAP